MINKTRIARKFVASPLGYFLSKANNLSSLICEEIKPVASIVDDEHCTIKFTCPSKLCFWRAKTLLSKEPDTIDWIKSFKTDSVFYDVGANIGCYTLYAAKKRNCRVVAFEPESLNYALLNTNIHLNSLAENIEAYNIALSDKNELSRLNLSSFGWGQALHNFGASVDYNKKDFKADFKQGALGLTLDNLIEVFNAPIPNYLKVDVDGLEVEVLKGAKSLLKKEELFSILIELNDKLPSDQELKKYIESCGFKLEQKYHHPDFDEGDFSSVFNYIFERN